MKVPVSSEGDEIPQVLSRERGKGREASPTGAQREQEEEEKERESLSGVGKVSIQAD